MRRRDFLAAGCVAACLPVTTDAADTSPQSFTLANDRWAIGIDPRTLELTVRVEGRSAVSVSRGVGPRGVDRLAHSGTDASWTWEGAIDVACRLDGQDLAITVTAHAATELPLIDQPAAAIGRGMLLPLGEGYHVPPDDAAWRGFLLHGDSERNTTEDLTLPLWGLDHGDFTLHWLLTNPFNNRLRFHDDQGGLGVMLDHAFTSLAPETPMTLMLHLGADDLLAGSKRYRRHLIENGGYTSLAQKMARTPNARRLIGATHIYLWGNGLVGNADIKDWPGFVAILRGGSPLATTLRAQMDNEAQGSLATVSTATPAYQKRAIVAEFNEALNAVARSRWQNDDVSIPALVGAYSDLRTQVVATFGATLRPDPKTWGDGLSAATFAALGKAGLERLWIGLGDGWEGGLWRPEAVHAGIAGGYLVAPYDSYETAIAPGRRPDWATAQLGRDAFDRCAIIKADGKPQAGFQQEGHYTNTKCVMPILKQRVTAIAKAGGFNSWFIDAFAAGMVFDDYRSNHPTTMAQNAAANNEACRWISESLDLPTGSEVGNAITADGVLFAHGTETPVIGWGDPDLQKNAASPFFLGKWYPSDGPSIFFKSVPMKEPYKTVYLTPATRLPLYQGVFHGSVISTHHWLFDQLKIANALADRAIIQQLYNVPALFHLNAATLATRLPAIKRNDAFFRPAHIQLAEKTLERFDWLSPDRRLQQTTFSDGTRLIANFDTAPRVHDGKSLPARSVTAIGLAQTPPPFIA